MARTSPKPSPPTCRESTSGQADSRVRTFLYLAGKEGLPENEALSFLKLLDCSKARLPRIDPNGLSLKMLKICSPLIEDGTLRPFSIRWPKSAKFRDYLDVQAAFRNYSATNALLILATKPDARRLGDKDFWRDQGVYIKRQEFGRPIKIVESNGEYTRDDGSIGVSYNIKRVYDISQTTARMKAQPPVSHDARALLGALIYKKPVPIQSVDELPNDMGALYDHEQKAIFVCRGMGASDLFYEVSKALAHAELAMTNENYSYSTADFKAHCVSYILCKEFGIETDNLSFSPADFDIPKELSEADPQEIRAELSEIRDTAYDISARMVRSLEQSKTPRQSEQER